MSESDAHTVVIWIAVTAPALLVIGAVIWWIVRSRGFEPGAWPCPRCGYDLRGVSDRETTACPECGADLVRGDVLRSVMEDDAQD